MKKVILIVIGILVLGGMLAFAIFNPGKKKGTDVYVATAEAGDVTSMVTASGEVQPKTKVNISSNIPGKIVALPVKEGDIVKEGAVLIRIDQEQYLSEVHSLEANMRMSKVAVESEETRLRTYESQLKRAESLKAEGILPTEAYENTRLAHDSSVINLKSLRESVMQAEASLAKARDELSKTVIYAPMSGKITQLNTEVGEQVIVGTTNIPGSQIMVIADMSEVLAEVDVDETEVVKVKVGQPVKIVTDAVDKVEYAGHVSEIRNSAHKKGDVNVFGVKVQFDSPDERLRPGMSAKARIQIEDRGGVLRIPIQAVMEKTQKELDEEIASASGKKSKNSKDAPDERIAKLEKKDDSGTPKEEAADGSAANGAGDATVASGTADAATPGATSSTSSRGSRNDATFEVVYVNRSGKAEAIRVKTGLADETNVEVLSGLKPGDSVITGPYRVLRKLKQGDPVNEKKEEDFVPDSGVKVEVD